MIGPAGTISAIASIMYIWYRPIMGNMVRPAGTICAITYITYCISGTGRSWGIWYDRPVPFVQSHTSRISGNGRSLGIWYDQLVPFVQSHDHVHLVLAER